MALDVQAGRWGHCSHLWNTSRGCRGHQFGGGHQWKHDEGHSLKFYLAEASFNESHTQTVCVLGKPNQKRAEGQLTLASYRAGSDPFAALGEIELWRPPPPQFATLTVNNSSVE